MHSEIKKINYFKNNIDLLYVCTDKDENAATQSRKLFGKINKTNVHLAVPIQNHTENVVWSTRSGTYNNCDGIASNLNYGIALSLSVADCVPVCIFDPRTKNFALLHSGWKGTYKRIAVNAIELLLEKQSKAKDIMVYCGPSISQKNYEVDWNVASLFSKKNTKISEKKFLLDIKSQIKDDLISVGIKSDNISFSKECTYDNNNLHSYRRDGDKVGRIIFLMGEFIGRD